MSTGPSTGVDVIAPGRRDPLLGKHNPVFRSVFEQPLIQDILAKSIDELGTTAWPRSSPTGYPARWPKAKGSMIKFSDIEDAFLFVSSGPYGMHTAVVCKDTGRILYSSEMGDLDEIGDEDLDWDTCVEIPHKNDLDLGKRLVFEFIETHLPDEYHRVQEMFRSRGAYGRFKDLLNSEGLLEIWYAFESERQEEALRQWCEENEIELSAS